MGKDERDVVLILVNRCPGSGRNSVTEEGRMLEGSVVSAPGTGDPVTKLPPLQRDGTGKACFVPKDPCTWTAVTAPASRNCPEVRIFQLLSRTRGESFGSLLHCQRNLGLVDRKKGLKGKM